MKNLFFVSAFIFASNSFADDLAKNLVISKKSGDALTDSSGQIHTLKCGLGRFESSYIALNSEPGTWGLLSAERIKINSYEECEKLKKFIDENSTNGVTVSIDVKDNKLNDYKGITSTGIEFSKDSIVISKAEGQCYSSDVEIVSHTGVVHLLRCEIGNLAPVDIALNSRLGTWGVLSAEKISIKTLKECENLKEQIFNSAEPTVIEFDKSGLVKFGKLQG